MSERPDLRLLRGGAPEAGDPADRRRGESPAEAPSGSRGLGSTGLAASGSRGLGSTGLAASGSRGLVSTALAAAGSWLLEPADPVREPAVAAPGPQRPVVAVFGLARGCGVTVVSRALAAELASRGAEEAAAVHCDARATGIPLATHAATQLARALADVPGADTRAVGRLCLVGGADGGRLADTARHLAPLVIDAGSTSLGGAPAALADRVVLVAAPAIEPALARVAADCLARLGHEPVVVLNRAASEARYAQTATGDRGRADGDSRESIAAQPSTVATIGSANEGDPRGGPSRPPTGAGDGWSAPSPLRLPDSRMGAQLALGGREPRGGLGRAIAELADLCEGRR